MCLYTEINHNLFLNNVYIHFFIYKEITINKQSR